MAVQIPPWLNIDPIAPARLRLQANAQRSADAASERAAQLHAQDLQFRREQAAAQQAQESERQAAQERSALRRDQVLKQTNDRELAQAAGQMQLRREFQAQKAEQFQQTLRMKQQAAEAEAKVAARQMQGVRAYQEGLQKGIPQQELLAKYGADIFAKNPSGMVGAFQRGSRVAAVPDYIAHELRDEQNNPTGIKVIPGAHGSIKQLQRTDLSPEGRMRQDQLLAGIYSKQLDTATGDEEVALQKKLTGLRDRIEKDIERRGTQPVSIGPTLGRGAVASPAGVNALAPAAAPAPISDTVRVKAPTGEIGVLPRASWEAATKEEKKGFEEIGSEATEPDFTEEQDAGNEE